ncbi:MAG: hypothetical protein Q9160_004360 [Pyrenula sp. 1 TL-2023]
MASMGSKPSLPALSERDCKSCCREASDWRREARMEQRRHGARELSKQNNIADSAGSLQWVPFPTCNETLSPLALPFNTPMTLPCTIDSLSDELYHLLEFYTHDDVPLTCRIPSTPLSATSSNSPSSAALDDSTSSLVSWTPLTIALQGTLQLSHLHIHTSINTLLHTVPVTPSPPNPKSQPLPPHLQPYRIIASTAYSVPNTTPPSLSQQGSKIIRNEPLTFTFNLGWIDGDVLPGMAGRPATASVREHGVGFALLSFFALGASAGVGGIVVLFYERGRFRRRGKGMEGLLGGGGMMGRAGGGGGLGGYGGYGSYGGYGGTGSGKRD